MKTLHHLIREAIMFKHILLATDGSSTAERAATLAVDLARIHGAKITALYVVDPYPYLGIGEANPYGFQAYMSAAQELGVQAHAKVTAMCSAGGTTVQMTPRVVEDVTAYRGIVDTAEAEDADLIVMGSHGRTGLPRLLLGSVVAKVVAQASVPVLVVR
jgi:nucleotide-binding universal stress UspA family protein